MSDDNLLCVRYVSRWRVRTKLYATRSFRIPRTPFLCITLSRVVYATATAAATIMSKIKILSRPRATRLYRFQRGHRVNRVYCKSNAEHDNMMPFNEVTRRHVVVTVLYVIIMGSASGGAGCTRATPKML